MVMYAVSVSSGLSVADPKYFFPTDFARVLSCAVDVALGAVAVVVDPSPPLPVLFSTKCYYWHQEMANGLLEGIESTTDCCTYRYNQIRKWLVLSSSHLHLQKINYLVQL